MCISNFLSQIFFILSFLYIFRICLAFVFSGFTVLLYYEVFYFFLILSFLPISLYIFRFYYIFCIMKFFTFSILLCFSNVLCFEFSQPLPIGFLSRKCFIYLFVLQSRQMCFSYQ